MFDDRVCTIGPNVADGDAIFLRCLEINVVSACRDETDESKSRCALDDISCHPDLVDVDEIHIRDSRFDILISSIVVNLERVRQILEQMNVELVRADGGKV